MCEILGASAARRTDYNSYLREFFSHAEANPHGWGLALFDKGEPRVKKEPVSALQSAYVKELLLAPVESELMLAHIRYATKSGIEYRNTHPFVLRDSAERTWTLVHNGTIFESNVLSGFVARQFGTTDSERILRYLVSRINEERDKKGGAVRIQSDSVLSHCIRCDSILSNRMLSDAERIKVVEKVLYTITPENKVNVLISDGELLYVHTNYRSSLYILDDRYRVTVSTKPLDSGDWRELPLNTLLVFRKHEQIYQGAPHENEFFDSEEKMRFLFLDYSGI